MRKIEQKTLTIHSVVSAFSRSGKPILNSLKLFIDLKVLKPGFRSGMMRSEFGSEVPIADSATFK